MATFLCAARAGSAGASPAGVQLLPTGPSLVRFAVEVPEARVISAPGASDLSEVLIDGFGNDGPPGAPALPVRVILVAVPPTGDVQVRASASGERFADGVLLAPMATLDRGAEGEPPRYDRSADAYGARASRTPQPARVLGVSWMRNQRVASIAVSAADYVPATRHLALYRRVDVELGVAAAGNAGPPAEAIDPFEEVYREVLVNYEQGRHWRRPAGGRSFPGAGLDRATLDALAAPAVPETSVYVGRTWIKIAIPRTGFYKLDFGQLRNFSLFSALVRPDSVRLDSVRLFTWPGVPVLPEANYCDTCDFREVAIQFAEDGDGLFNHNADAFYFFAMGASDWADLYDPAQPDTVFINHPYETKNYYYLTVSTSDLPVGGGRQRIAQRSGQVQNVAGRSPSPAGVGFTTPATFEARVHAELDIEYFPDLSPLYYGPAGPFSDAFWEKWFWRSMSLGNLFAPTVDAIGIDSTQAGSVRIRQWGLPDPSDTCLYSVRNAQHLLDVAVNGVPLPREGWDGTAAFSFESATAALLTHNSVSLTIPVIPGCGKRFDRSALAWIELRYRRRFVPINNELAFDTDPGGGNYLFDISPFTSLVPPRVFDVTDAYAPVEVVNLGYSDLGGGNWGLSFQSIETERHRYRIVRDSSIIKVPDLSVFAAPATSLRNLRSRTRGADYVLIYYDGFQAAADSLMRWRQYRLPLTGQSAPYEVEEIPISALYDQFSGGRTDPSVIRNFLRAAFFNWSKRPAFVTLFGDASYDFKNLKGLAGAGQPGTLVPSYENGFAINKQFATDDWLLNVDDATVNIPDFFGGRIPAGDPRTALDFVMKKVLLYERSAPLGAYRDKVMLIADDNLQGAKDDPLHWAHLRQTAVLDTAHTPAHIDRAYVYLHTYPDGPGNTKPGAKADIKLNLNNGVAMSNYIGHGSPFKLADETVLSDVDAGTFTNATRPTLFVAASCDVGKFNDPTEIGRAHV